MAILWVYYGYPMVRSRCALVAVRLRSGSCIGSGSERKGRRLSPEMEERAGILCRIKEERAELTLLVIDVIPSSGRRDNTKNGGMIFRVMNKIEKPLGRGAAKRGKFRFHRMSKLDLDAMNRAFILSLVQ